MKITTLLATALIYALSQAGYAETAETRLTRFFGQSAEIAPLNDQFSRITIADQTYLASRDGRYIFAGAIIDTETRENLSDVENRRHCQKQLAELPKDWFISYPAKTSASHTVTVFTDIDCPYCRQMHSYMGAFNEMGITVNYIMMPRAGVGSASFDKAIAAFCAADPAQAVTSAMSGESLSAKQCAHTITEQYQLAQQLGIRATPTTVLPNGDMQAGLLNPQQLKALLTAAVKMTDNQ